MDAGPHYETFETQAKKPTPIDLLVVLDDTSAMSSHLPRPGVDQIGIVSLIYNGAPDVRIGVTTTTSGTLRTSTAVPTGIIEHRLDFGDGTLHTSYAGTLQQAIGSLTNVGTASTSENRIFEAAQEALAAPGFVRDTSGVGIFVVTGADDASPMTPSAYATAIQARGNPTMVSVVSPDDVAIDRVNAFADAIPLRWMVPMSRYNMEALTVFSWLWKPIDNDYCLPVSAKPDAAGQYDCDIVMTNDHVTHALGQCNGDAFSASEPCWQLIADESCSSGQVLVVGGGFAMYRPHLIGRCSVD